MSTGEEGTWRVSQQKVLVLRILSHDGSSQVIDKHQSNAKAYHNTAEERTAFRRNRGNNSAVESAQPRPAQQRVTDQDGITEARIHPVLEGVASEP